MKFFKNKGLRKVIIWLFWIIIWWLLSLAVNNHILLASPWDTLKVLGIRLGEGSFYLTILGSLLRIGAGFVLGFSVAVFLAIISKGFSWLEELLAPLMNLIKRLS